MPDPLPDFETAVSQFQQFLCGQGLPKDILWVCREDITCYKRRVWVRVPLPETNRAFAEQQYLHGLELGQGVCIEMFCLLGTRACCHVWYAADEEDATYRMCWGLRFKVPTDPINARSVRSRFLWKIVDGYNRRAGWNHRADSVLGRSTLEPAR